MNIIRMSKFRKMRRAIYVVFTDLQVEYVTSGRAFAIDAVQPCLERCRLLLECVRDLGLPVCHFRQLGTGEYFNSGSKFSHWIEDFRPRPNEMVFERTLPSCYSNEAFASLLERSGDPTVVLAGLAGEEAVLSTAVDALHRDHKLIFVQDASASHSVAGWSEAETHEFLTNLIAIYSDVTTAQEMTRQFRHNPLRSLYQ